MHYFERLGDSSFRATEYTLGAWSPAEQHIAPSLGLLAHVIERTVTVVVTTGYR